MRSFFEKPSQKKLREKLKILEDQEKMLEEKFIVSNYKDLIIPSTIFLASEKSIIVFSL